MSRKNVGGRRNLTWVWIALATVVIFALLYWEQTAILYVLATLGVTALLVVVAFSDLSGAKRLSTEMHTEADDSAALGSGIGQSLTAGAAPQTTFGGRTRKRRSPSQPS